MNLRTMIRTSLLLLIILMSACRQQKEQSTKSRKQQWMEDIAYFENEYLKESETFSKDSLAACQQILAQLKSNIDSLNDHQLTLQLSRCMAMADNAHTVMPLGFMKKVPVRFYRFADGLRIIKTDSALQSYRGAKLLKINSMPVEEVEAKLYPYLPGVKRWKSYKASNYLASPEILNGIGLSDSESMMLTLLQDNDTLEIKVSTKEMKKKYLENWSDLYPDPEEKEWKHVLPHNSKKPLYLDRMKEGVFYDFMEAEKLAYFSINGYWDQAEDFEGKIDEFLEKLKSKTDYDVLVDLRYFTGGNYLIPTDLAKEPPQIINQDKKIYLITSNMTFSAGLVTAARIKYFAGDKIVIVGEEVGDRLKFWAENDPYRLPNSEIYIADSKAEHDWKDDTFTFGTTFWVNYFYGVPAKSLAVDKEIKLSFSDYLKGEDPMLNWIVQKKNSLAVKK